LWTGVVISEENTSSLFCVEVCGFGNIFYSTDIEGKEGPGMQVEEVHKANGKKRTGGGPQSGSRWLIAIFSPFNGPSSPTVPYFSHEVGGNIFLRNISTCPQH
jgi:hypothetical protein